MNVFSFVFSPTGGTEKVMQILEGEFAVNRVFDLTKEQDLSSVSVGESDICLFGIPSYGGRAPGIAVESIRTIKGNGARAILVAVYGNRDIDDTLLELKDEAEQCGFRIVGAIKAVAEHSIVHRVGAGRPDDIDKTELKKFAETILENLDNPEAVRVPGRRPYRQYNGVPFKPKSTKDCSSCGLCVKKCPVGAIQIRDRAITDKNRCISCMCCVTICPNSARKVNSLFLAAASKKMEKLCALRANNGIFVGHSYNLDAAHDYSIYNKDQLAASSICGCFCCLKIFLPDEITEWCDPEEDTALCPYCEIDSVLGDASGFEITMPFLLRMNERYFGGAYLDEDG